MTELPELTEMTTWTNGCRLPQVGDESTYEGYETIIKDVKVLGPSDYQHPHQGTCIDIQILHEVKDTCQDELMPYCDRQTILILAEIDSSLKTLMTREERIEFWKSSPFSKCVGV